MSSEGERLGQLVKAWREKNDVTQADVALDVFGDANRKSDVSNLENGRILNPHVRTITAYCNHIGVDVSEILQPSEDTYRVEHEVNEEILAIVSGVIQGFDGGYMALTTRGDRSGHNAVSLSLFRVVYGDEISRESNDSELTAARVLCDFAESFEDDVRLMHKSVGDDLDVDRFLGDLDHKNFSAYLGYAARMLDHSDRDFKYPLRDVIQTANSRVKDEHQNRLRAAYLARQASTEPE